MLKPVSTVLNSKETRAITLAEKLFYKVQKELYMERCLRSPCDRKLREHFKNIVNILETGRIGTTEHSL